MKVEHNIIIHEDPQDWQGMREAGNLTALALDSLSYIIGPGVTTNDLDDFIAKFAKDHGASCATLGYGGRSVANDYIGGGSATRRIPFPKSICTSVNHVVCHGIPNAKPLKSGDIVNIDITLNLNGWHGDSSKMFLIGTPSRKATRICEIAYQAMWEGINQVKPGNTTGDIGFAIEEFAIKNRCSSVYEYGGHGIGRQFHCLPEVAAIGQKGQGTVLKPGMFFTIEPMINIGSAHTKTLKDGWTVVTRDKSLSAQYEHTIGVTETGYEIFTEGRPLAANGH